MSYINSTELTGYYFKQDILSDLLKEISDFIDDGRNDLFQIHTEGVVIEWDNQVGKYIASIYLRKF